MRNILQDLLMKLWYNSSLFESRSKPHHPHEEDYISVVDIPSGTFLENTDNEHSSNISPEDVVIVRVSCTNERRADGSSGVEIDVDGMREEFEEKLKETIDYYERNFG